MDVEPEDRCAVCWSILCEPVPWPNCNHYFCLLCAFRTRRRAKPVCPLCRGPAPCVPNCAAALPVSGLRANEVRASVGASKYESHRREMWAAFSALKEDDADDFDDASAPSMDIWQHEGAYYRDARSARSPALPDRSQDLVRIQHLRDRLAELHRDTDSSDDDAISAELMDPTSVSRRLIAQQSSRPEQVSMVAMMLAYRNLHQQVTSELFDIAVETAMLAGIVADTRNAHRSASSTSSGRHLEAGGEAIVTRRVRRTERQATQRDAASTVHTINGSWSSPRRQQSRLAGPQRHDDNQQGSTMRNVTRLVTKLRTQNRRRTTGSSLFDTPSRRMEAPSRRPSLQSEGSVDRPAAFRHSLYAPSLDTNPDDLERFSLATLGGTDFHTTDVAGIGNPTPRQRGQPRHRVLAGTRRRELDRWRA